MGRQNASSPSLFHGRHFFSHHGTVVDSLLIVAQELPIGYISSSNVIVSYPINISKSAVQIYLVVIDSMCSEATSNLKIQMDKKLRVHLCRDAFEFEDVTGVDSILSPLWKDGTLYVTVNNDLSGKDFRSELDAGIIEGILDRLRENGAPRWLIYSAAAYISGEYKNSPPPPVESVSYFSDLNEKIQDATATTDPVDLWFYLGNTGKFFDTEYGSGSLVKLLQEFEHLNSINAAVRNLFNMSYDHVESDWHDFLVTASQQAR